VYQVNETGAWHRLLRALPDEPGRVTHLPARRSDKGRPETGIRVRRKYICSREELGVRG
jgi:hypothetical protein